MDNKIKLKDNGAAPVAKETKHDEHKMLLVRWKDCEDKTNLVDLDKAR
jgi:hypothetical protein